MLYMSRDNVYMLAALLYRDILAYVDREQKGEQKDETEQNQHSACDCGPTNAG